MIYSLSGPSCAGKTTLLARLRYEITGIEPLVSVTTREARPSDQPGEYRYVSDEEFDRMEKEGLFLWTVRPFGASRYGTLTWSIETALRSSREFVPILTLDAVRILMRYADDYGLERKVVPFYLCIRNEKMLHQRFKERGDTNTQQIKVRMGAVKKELAEYEKLKEVIPFRELHADHPAQEVLAQAYFYIVNAREPRP